MPNLRKPAGCALGVAALFAAPCSAQFELLDEMSLDDLLQVRVVSVSRKGQDVMDVPAAFDVLTSDDIRHSTARTTPELLRDAAGVHALRSNSRDWGISIRGFNNANPYFMEVVQDGRSLYTPLFAGVWWDQVDTLLPDIDRVEVMRGPSAALWGPNAVNGVINIYTKPASETQGWLVETRAGTAGDVGLGARYGFQLSDNTHMRVFTKFSFIEDVRSPSGRRWPGDSNEALRAGTRLDSVLANDGTLMLQLEGFHSGTDLLAETRDVIETHGWFAITRYEQQPDPDSFLAVQANVEGLRKAYPGFFGETRRTFEFSGQYNFHPHSRHEIVTGAQVRSSWDHTDEEAFITFEPTSGTTHLFNIYAQDEIELVRDELHLILGGMVLYGTLADWVFQPAARLRWQPWETLTLWSAVSQAARAPTRIDTDVIFWNAAGNPAIVGNPEYKPERAQSFELGGRWKVAETLILDTSVYFTKHSRLRTLEERPEGNSTFLNNMEGHSHGVELQATFHPAFWFQAQLSGTYHDKRLFLVSPDRGSIDGGFFDPQFFGMGRLSFELPSNVELDAYVRYAGELSPNIPAYWGVDLRLSWAPSDRTEFSLVGMNLLDDLHPEMTVARQVSRNVYGQVTWRF